MYKSKGLKDRRAWFSDQILLSASVLMFANNMLIFTCLFNLLPSSQQCLCVTLRLWKENYWRCRKYCFILWADWRCRLSYGCVCAVKQGLVQDPWSSSKYRTVLQHRGAVPEGLTLSLTVPWGCGSATLAWFSSQMTRGTQIFNHLLHCAS